MGVRGMNLDDGDEVVAMQLNSQGDCLLIVSANGMGKRTSIGEFTCQNREKTAALAYGSKKLAWLNGVECAPSELTGEFLAVVFSPGAAGWGQS